MNIEFSIPNYKFIYYYLCGKVNCTLKERERSDLRLSCPDIPVWELNMHGYGNRKMMFVSKKSPHKYIPEVGVYSSSVYHTSFLINNLDRKIVEIMESIADIEITNTHATIICTNGKRITGTLKSKLNKS